MSSTDAFDGFTLPAVVLGRFELCAEGIIETHGHIEHRRYQRDLDDFPSLNRRRMASRSVLSLCAVLRVTASAHATVATTRFALLQPIVNEPLQLRLSLRSRGPFFPRYDA